MNSEVILLGYLRRWKSILKKIQCADGESMCSQPTMSYMPDYKSFKFNDKNVDMKEHREDEGTSTSEDLFVYEVENQGCGVIPYLVRNSVRDTEDWVDEKDRHGEQYPDSHGDSEYIGRRKNYHTTKRDMAVEFELPELVVFLQESCYHFVKDICIDKEMPCHAKCSVENCELDHNNITCILNPDAECIDSEPAIQNLETFPSISTGSKPESEVDEDAKDEISADDFTKQIVPESLLLVREIQKAVLADSIVSSAAEETQEESQTRKASIVTDEPANEDGILLETPTGGLCQIYQHCFGESSTSFGVGPCSGPILSSRSISLRSNSSTASSRSFAFPILAPEWNGSPVRMVKADRPPLRKHRGWGIRFFCCKV